MKSGQPRSTSESMLSDGRAGRLERKLLHCPIVDLRVLSINLAKGWNIHDLGWSLYEKKVVYFLKSGRQPFSCHVWAFWNCHGISCMIGTALTAMLIYYNDHIMKQR